MKKSLVVLLSAVLTSQAALVYFDISPPGSDAALGLNPANEVPPVTNSTGSGGPISAGVVFDLDASTLHLAIGYGSAAGFTDLSGPVTQLSINGPARAGQTNGPLVDLAPFIFPAVDPAKGGVIYGKVVYPTNAVPDLLAGSNYVNLATAANPAGEIRGQLVPIAPTNSAPVVECPDPATVECGTLAEVKVVVSDPDGDAMKAIWTLNGRKVQTNTVPASKPSAAMELSFSRVMPLGTNIVGVAVTDSHTNRASCSTTVRVVDTLPPVIHGAGARPNVLWPPNHKMVYVQVEARVADQCGPATWEIIDVYSNEPVNGLGDGDTAPDWLIARHHLGAYLRAERSGNGTDRIYSIVIQAKDRSGNLSEPTTVTVTVPKSQGKKPK
jgi:hypothetical protein